MSYLKKYYFIFILMGFSLAIVLIYWGSGRFMVFVSSMIASFGYYLVVQGREGKHLAKSIIDDNELVKNGFARLKGNVVAKDIMSSYIGEHPVVFYEVLVEKGSVDYSSYGEFEPRNLDNSTPNHFRNAKWKTIKRKSEWRNFYIETKNNLKILIEEPEKASGQWIFTKETIPEMNIDTYEDSNQKIKELLDQSKENIESGRYIRYMERTIKEGDEVIVYGSVKNSDDDPNISYILTQGKDGYFIITNDSSYDFLYEEKRQYNIGMTVFVLGILGMVISYFWPIIISNASNVSL